MNSRRFHNACTDSTSERAFAALAAGRAEHGDVHVADEQDAGHGRFGRRWHSPAGAGVYLSMILLPPPPPWHPGAVTVAAALAAHDAVVSLGLRSAWLDWPNDLMAGEAKLGGILVETRGLDPRRPHFVVGVGINVLHSQLPPELTAARSVTSLAAEGVSVAVARVEQELLDGLSRRFEQVDSTPAELEVDFVHATGLSNREVLVRSGESEVRGRFAGFSFAAGLLLHLAGGREQRLPLEFVRAVERL